MGMLRFAGLVLLMAAAVVFPELSRADSIGQSAQSGTDYTYDLYAPGGSVSFSAGDTISVTGFSDLVNVTLSQDAAYAGTVTWDATSVTYTLTSDETWNPGSPIDLQMFTASSSNSSMGQLSYTIQEASSTESGTIPATSAADTPEPATLVLMATGVAVLVVVQRRRGAGATAPAAGFRPAI